MFVFGFCGLASLPFHPQWLRSFQHVYASVCRARAFGRCCMFRKFLLITFPLFLCCSLSSKILPVFSENYIFTRESRMLRASLPSYGRLSVCPSVCLSVRPSVTLVGCIKTVPVRIMKSSLWAAPRSLVYRDKISCHWVQGFPLNEGVKEGYPPPKKTSICRYWLE